jgi:eukaryotic-like serine/threonine-protein kinase
MAEPDPSPLPSPGRGPGAVLFGPFRFDAAEGALRRDGREVPLPPRALGVLALLLAHAGRLVPKQVLVDTVWSDAFVTETSLAEAVSVVRQALGDNPQSPTYIQTVHRRGYRFIAATRAEAGAPPGAMERAAAVHPDGAPRRWRKPVADGEPSRRDRRRRRAGGLALGIAAAAALAASLAGLWTRAHSPARPAGADSVRRLLIALPPGASLEAGPGPALALSPAGDRLVYAAREGSVQRLYLRALDSFEARPIAGTEGAAAPFSSPDGQWIGFFARGRLWKVALAGGEPLALCDAPYPEGASWGEDGTILFASDYAAGLRRVPAAGGAAAALTAPDRAAGEVGHRWPEVLPGSRAALLTVWRRGGWQDASVELLDLRSGRRKPLLRGASFARWSPTGHLVFLRAGGAPGLAAVPFDLGRLEVLGPPVAVLGGVRSDPAQGSGQLALARDGSLVYAPGGAEGSARTVVRVGLAAGPAGGAAAAAVAPAGDGHALPLPARPFRNLALSPDGQRLALTVRELDRSEVWVTEIGRGNLSRLTFEGDNVEPVWSPDGRWLAFAGARAGGRYELYRVPADGSGPPERLLAGGNGRFPTSFSPDGRLLAFTEMTPGSGSDLWVLPLGGAPRPFLRSAFDEAHGRFSPDGRWLAYESDESGAAEVYLRPFPGPGGKWQLSAGGGSRPAWSADGRRIFYRHGTALMAVALRFAGNAGATAAPPETLLDGEPDLDRFAVDPGGRGVFLFRRAVEQPDRLRVVLGFGSELARLAPPAGRRPPAVSPG